MVRTQIQISEDQAEALRSRAAREKVSVSELVRRAVDAFIRSNRPSLEEQRDRAMKAAGRFASGTHDTSTRHDEVLGDAFRVS